MIACPQECRVSKIDCPVLKSRPIADRAHYAIASFVLARAHNDQTGSIRPHVIMDLKKKIRKDVAAVAGTVLRAKNRDCPYV